MTNKFDPTKPVQTRDGNKVRIICTDAIGCDFPILALVMVEPGREQLYSYCLNGNWAADGDTRNCDLVNIPPSVVSITTTLFTRLVASVHHMMTLRRS